MIIFIASSLLFSQVHALQKDRQAMATLQPRFRSPGRDPFVDPSRPLFGSPPILWELLLYGIYRNVSSGYLQEIRFVEADSKQSYVEILGC